jgi:hypothetical protein
VVEKINECVGEFSLVDTHAKVVDFVGISFRIFGEGGLLSKIIVQYR